METVRTTNCGLPDCAGFASLSFVQTAHPDFLTHTAPFSHRIAMDAPFITLLDQAVADGKLLVAARANIDTLLQNSDNPLYADAIAELAGSGEWEELNDRFFQTLAFGTGGLRGRSIGRIVTRAERGNPSPLGCPEHPCVGTNALNTFNISRATQGLVRYIHQWLASQQRTERPKIAISHDTRHFSRAFAELTARVAAELGCDVYLVESYRSTPQLSFAVRQTGSHGGVMITASHNPAHDNGYKVYFEDGAQVLPPHDRGIIEQVNATPTESWTALPADRQGTIHTLGADLDQTYIARLRNVCLRPDLLRNSTLRIVYTPIHGTGAVTILPLMESLGIRLDTVPEQMEGDGRFPTVPSPNPENASALALGIAKADAIQADLLLATDPDDDRMGAAIRGADGQMHIITGNQIGSLLAYYRIATLFEKGILTDDNKAHAIVVKTFVTTDLQQAVAEHFGLRCVDTLTGFKYIGRKLAKYEAALPDTIRVGYRSLSEEASRDARLAHSTYFVFGSEESYGYLAADFVRDKDANMAALLFIELAAWLHAEGRTLHGYLDDIYARLGYYTEKTVSLYFEGAAGAAKIRALVDSYTNHPPTAVGSWAVTALTDFGSQTIHDLEGDEIPKEKMILLQLGDGFRAAVRASGTEPKIKYYLFGAKRPTPGTRFDPAQLTAAKEEVTRRLEELWNALETDANERIGKNS